MKTKIFSAILIACAIAFGFTSCRQNDPDNPDTKNHDTTKPQYSIMFYTVAGGDLDLAIESNLMDAMDALQANDVSVRFFVQMKYSN